MFLTAPPSCTVCSAKREWTAKMVRLGAGDKGNTIQQIIFKSAKDNPTDMINITSTFFLLIHELCSLNTVEGRSQLLGPGR